MRSVLQRVSRAEVRVEGIPVGSIDRGVLLLVGFAHSDGIDEVEWSAKKIAGLRVFEDEAGKMNLSLSEVGGRALVVSQFTLYADVRKGRRPSFVDAASPEEAKELYELFCNKLSREGIHVEKGTFGARMNVELVNDGPVTIVIESP